MVTLNDLFNDRKLRKITPDLDKCTQSITIAEKKLRESKELLVSGFYEQSILSAYTSMFHIARSLLYRDGIQEKSHYAVYIYLKEKYYNSISLNLLESFLNHQLERKEILYGFDYSVNLEEAESCIDDAKAFFKEVSDLLL